VSIFSERQLAVKIVSIFSERQLAVKIVWTCKVLTIGLPCVSEYTPSPWRAPVSQSCR